jgi:hypothetical protein
VTGASCAGFALAVPLKTAYRLFVCSQVVLGLGVVFFDASRTRAAAAVSVSAEDERRALLKSDLEAKLLPGPDLAENGSDGPVSGMRGG